VDEEAVMESTTPDAEHEIMIEDTLYQWGKPTITGQEIKELAGIPQDAAVVKVDLVADTQEPLNDSDVHELPPLEPGKGIVKRVAFRRG
jgi:Multiubiquitin